MPERTDGQDATDAVILRFPFRGRWQARNSPADRVPSHGTDLFGTTYAIDFVSVDARGRTAPRDWRSALATEPPDRFFAFGSPILAPADGEVVQAHDGEPDYSARRSALTVVPYLLTQASRVRRGAAGVAGNHVVLAVRGGAFVLLAHLRRGSLLVGVGDRVALGDQVGDCGNSGNSTEPHVHVQATDSIDWPTVRGLPIAFVDGRASDPWLPRNGRAFEAS